MSTHPADFAKQLEQSNWFNRMKDVDMTRQEETARPQDVALLPLPELPVPHGGMTGDYWTDDQIEEYATDYARANVTAALASARAREDELRAERDAYKAADESMQQAHYEALVRAREAEARAERLAEALRELFDDYKRLADSGDAGFWKLEDTYAGKKALAALSTNAATQTGETT